MQITLTQDRKLAWRGGGSYRYARLLLEAPVLPTTTERPAINVALVLDRSGSMTGEKIEYARQALLAVVAGLDRRDTASLTVFDHEVNVLVPARTMDPEGVRAMREAITRTAARGNTALFDGWLLGSREAALHQHAAGLSRVVLVSDGLANQGLTDRTQIAAHVGELRARGISSSTIGVGVDFDEVLLRSMAEMGGGNFHFVEHPAVIPQVVRGEFGELMRPYATGIEVRVLAPPGVRVQAWNEVPASTSGSIPVFQLGDLAQGMTTDLVLNAVFPAGMEGERLEIALEIAWADALTRERKAHREAFACTYARGSENTPQPRDNDVALRVVEVWAARVRRAALERNRTGDYHAARELVLREMDFLRRYAEGVPGAEALIGELDPFAHEVSMAMAAPRMKAYESSSFQARRMRQDYTKPRPQH
jgi:Ca-activated chloride channel family protein